MFASSVPVAREDLARVVEQGASVDLLIDDLRADLDARPYEIAKTGKGWLLHTRTAYDPVIRAAADIGDLTSLDDLPDTEQLQDAGLAQDNSSDDEGDVLPQPSLPYSEDLQSQLSFHRQLQRPRRTLSVPRPAWRSGRGLSGRVPVA